MHSTWKRAADREQCPEQIVGGDVNALRQHAAAVGRIVKLRGGLENMGFSNFMKQLIAWFLENPERRDVPCLLPAIDAADRVSATEMMAMSAAGVLVSDQARPGFSYETTSS